MALIGPVDLPRSRRVNKYNFAVIRMLCYGPYPLTMLTTPGFESTWLLPVNLRTQREILNEAMKRKNRAGSLKTALLVASQNRG